MKTSPNKLNRESKDCLSCGRSFQNRRKWSSRGIWDEIKYCSDRCRANK